MPTISPNDDSTKIITRSRQCSLILLIVSTIVVLSILFEDASQLDGAISDWTLSSRSRNPCTSHPNRTPTDIPHFDIP